MKLKVIALSAATLGCSLLLSQPASAISGVPWQVLLQTTSETAPNAALLPSSPDGFFGNTRSTSCPVNSEDPANVCWNPLEIEFDITSVNTSSATPQPAVLGALSEPTMPSENILQLTNSLDSSDGGVSNITANFGCSASVLNGNITVTQEDGAVFTFVVASGSCDFSTAPTFTFTSTGGSSGSDSGNATLYVFPNTIISGNYAGVWDSSTTSDTPFQPGTASGPQSQIDLTINGDFTVSGSATIPADGFGSCPSVTEMLDTSTATSMGQGITSTVGGYATGGDVVATVADSEGDVLWLFGSTTDATGHQLTGGQLFFSTYVAVAGSGMSSCPNGIFWDAPFQKHGKPEGNPITFRKHLHASVPHHKPELHDRKNPLNERTRDHDADDQKFALNPKNSW